MMRCNVIVYFFIVFFTQLIFAASTNLKNELDRTTDAVAKAYGNKYANLLRLQKTVIKNSELKEKLSRCGGYTVDVPSFTGFSDEQSRQFLKMQGYDVVGAWNKIPTELSDDEFINKSQEISSAISNLGGRMTDVPMLKILALKKIAEGLKSKLMERSSGIEDTCDVSNAGGNESFSNVDVSSWQSMNRFANKVMASYFSRKSIGQRLIENDKTIRKIPLIPVLYQLMIGEQENGASDVGQIPVGCVVHTQESYANTPGVTFIQASWGHNTGVVDNTVVVDTYIIDENENVNALIKIKPERWMPVFKDKEHKLEKVKNPESIQTKSVLTIQDALAIKVVADAIQQEYGKVIDIELVYMPHERKIHLVQARPLKITLEFKPSYLQTFNGIAGENLLYGTTVLPGNCQLRHITNKDQIIVMNTLNDALEVFDAPEDDEKIKQARQAAVQMVIVRGGAEATSHAAAIFRGIRTPVLVVENIEKIRQWLQDGNVSIIVDIQRGVVAHKKIEDVQVKDGWFTHPLPKKISIPNIITKMKEKAFLDNYPEKKLQELVNILKSADQAEVQQILDAILYRINNQREDVYANKLKLQQTNDTIVTLEQLYTYACNCAKTIKSVSAGPAFDIARLFQIHFLECLLFQKEDNACVNVFSLQSIVHRYKSESAFISKLLPIVGIANLQVITQDNNLFVAALNGFDCALTQATESQWLNFIAAVGKSDGTTQQKFAQFANAMISFKALSAWINTIFATTWNNSINIKTYINDLSEQLNHSDEFLKSLNELRQKIKVFDLSCWQDPALFQKTYKQFVSEFVTPCTSETFKIDYESSPKLTKLMAIGLMDSLVELFDKSIKNLKGSTRYSSVEDKVINFKIMLGGYFDLLNTLVDLLPVGAFISSNNWQLDEYLSYIKNALDKLDNNADQLNPTQGFSVANAALGSAVQLAYKFHPKLAEDIFTLIHQNLLITLGALTKIVLPTNWPKPEMITKAESVLLSQSYIKFVSIKFEKGSFTARYNLPMVNHSLIFELFFDKKTNETLLSFIFVGDAGNKWEAMKEFAELRGNFVLRVKESNIGPAEVAITHILKYDEDISQLPGSIKAMVFASNGDTFSVLSDFFVNNTPKITVEPFFSRIKDKGITAFDMSVFIAFVRQNKAIEQAIDVLHNSLENNNFWIRSLAIDLFLVLFEKRQEISGDLNVKLLDLKAKIFEQGINSAMSGTKTDDAQIKYSAVNLFKILIENGYGFDAAYDLIKKFIKNEEYYYAQDLFDVFKQYSKDEAKIKELEEKIEVS